MLNSTKRITTGAVIAALYVVFTLIANAFGLANGDIQVRFSEALTVLPFYTPVAIYGLFVGCIISNILTGAMLFDVIFGSLATLIGAIGTYLIKRKLSNAGYAKYLAPVPPVIANTLIIPPLLAYVYKFEGSILFFGCTVCLGEIISCGILGLALMGIISRNNLDKYL